MNREGCPQAAELPRRFAFRVPTEEKNNGNRLATSNRAVPHGSSYIANRRKRRTAIDALIVRPRLGRRTLRVRQ